MSDVNLPLLIATVVWTVVVFAGVIPILRLPMSRAKREFSVVLAILGVLSIGIEWVTRRELHAVSGFALTALLVFSGVTLRLLRRLDYYVEELLQELFVLALCSGTISIVTSLWYWGIAGGMSLGITRIVVATIPIVSFIIAWYLTRQHYNIWSLAVYVTILLVKWLLFPNWGIWTVILVLLYGTLVGYVINWMVTTTYAEKVLAWNVEPAKIWSFLAVGAGLLVLFF